MDTPSAQGRLQLPVLHQGSWCVCPQSSICHAVPVRLHQGSGRRRLQTDEAVKDPESTMSQDGGRSAPAIFSHGAPRVSRNSIGSTLLIWRMNLMRKGYCFHA